jgi:hypothetical protein
VLHAGYGPLYEKPAAVPGPQVPSDVGDRYLTISRGLFLKASYLHRF